ncbi:WXG100 family type VII secretion target [Actinoplanes sp. NPDC026619]|uniref:WXG100 family type VII secretion target n=1 Tax=Actinoplanes sp. NPDC026619 TaxID=3155798 RepID=UPI0033C4B9D8
MAGQTQAQAHEMAKAAQNFDTVNQELQTMLSQLMTELSHLTSAWKGMGAQAFEQVKVQYESDLKQLNQALAETAESIRASGINYDSTDTSAASKLTSSGGSFSLPL